MMKQVLCERDDFDRSLSIIEDEIYCYDRAVNITVITKDSTEINLVALPCRVYGRVVISNRKHTYSYDFRVASIPEGVTELEAAIVHDISQFMRHPDNREDNLYLWSEGRIKIDSNLDSEESDM